MLYVFPVAYAILTVFLAGSLFHEIKPLSIKNEPAGIRFPVYFMTGSIILSLYMFALFLLGIKYSVISVSLPFMAYLIWRLSKNSSAIPDSFNNARNYSLRLLSEAGKKENLLFTVIFSLFAVVLLVIYLENTIMPIYIGDAYIHWFYKAKAIAMTRTIPMDILTSNILYYSALDYPLLVSLNVAWLSICAGQWIDTITKIFFTVSYLSSAVFLYFSLKKLFNIKEIFALIAAFITFTVPHMMGDITTGYVDVNVGLFVLFSVIFMYKWFTNVDDVPSLLLSSVFAGAAAWTKNDGIAHLLALTFTVFVYLAHSMFRKKLPTATAIKRFAAFIIVSGFVYLPFKLLTLSLKVENHMIITFNQLLQLPFNAGRIPFILKYFAYEFFLDSYLWLYFWIFLAVLVFINRKKIANSELRFVLAYLLASVVLFFCVYMVTALGETTGALVNNLELSLDRVMLGFTPSAGFLLFASSLKDDRAFTDKP
jgi:hypothetical protein